MDEEVQAEIDSLNRAFYDQYPRKYLEDAALLDLSALVDPTTALSPLHAGLVIDPGGGKPPLTLTRAPERPDEDSIKKTAKLRLVTTYYHTMETFLRLFFAHRQGILCPWTEMIGESNFRLFKQKVEEIRGWEPDWDGNTPEDESIQYVFLPVASPDPEKGQRLTAAKQWLRHAAEEILDTPAYNSFKHGLALQAGEAAVWYGTRETEGGTPTGEPLISAEGDALTFLTYMKQPDGSSRWIRHTQWFNVAEKFVAVFIVQHYYIDAILRVGAARFAGGSLGGLALPPWTPGEVFRQPSGISVERMSMDLGFVTPPRAGQPVLSEK